MIFSFVYDLVLYLFFLATLPKILFNWKKYRGTFGRRFGRGFPKIEKGEHTLVWVHAVSMGETKAVAPLIKKIKADPSAPLVILSTATKTGHEEGKKSEADWIVYLPVDLSYVIRPLVYRIRPDLVILMETDFWYHFQDAAKKCGAKLFVVNGKLSKRSFYRYKKFSLLIHYLLFPIDHFYVQGSLYQTRLKKLGILPSKITISGNIKLDASIEILKNPTRHQLGLVDHYVITLGSTHFPEERIWIKALKQLWKSHLHIKVLLVPRHPERFNDVAKMLEEEQLSYARWSEKGTLSACDVLLVDQMGVLSTCYYLCDLAFVGGSFTPKVGGHNILEPLFFEKPVLFGPYMFSQPDLLELVRSYDAAVQIQPKEIVSRVNQCIATPSFTRHLGKRGLKLITESKGALDKTFYSLQPLLEKSCS